MKLKISIETKEDPGLGSALAASKLTVLIPIVVFSYIKTEVQSNDKK